MPYALLLLILIFISGCSESPVVPPATPHKVQEPVVQNRISKTQLQEMFDNIAAKSDWNMDGDMVWGYFFTDANQPALEAAARTLESQGYRFVDIFQPEDDRKPLPYYLLHVEKIETHSVDSLYNRNTELESFAREHALDTYDGMDVGPVVVPNEG